MYNRCTIYLYCSCTGGGSVSVYRYTIYLYCNCTGGGSVSV